MTTNRTSEDVTSEFAIRDADVDVLAPAHAVLPQRQRAKKRKLTRDASARDDRRAHANANAHAVHATSKANDDEDEREGFERSERAIVRYAPECERAIDEGEDARRSARANALETEEDEDATRHRRGVRYAYKDHTADIQIHAWGADLAETFAWAALAMFDYMTPLEDCAKKATTRYKEIRASGHDLETLLFAFLDELLFTFHTEMFICTAVQVCEFNRDAWEIRAVVGGTTFVEGETRQGTEIKAITYSAMKIIEHTDSEIKAGAHPTELFVIVDI